VEVELAQQGLHRCTLIGRKILAREPVPAGAAEQIAHRRGRSQVAGQDGVHLVLDPGALSDQMGAAHHLPAQAAGSLVRQPDRRQEVGRQ